MKYNQFEELTTVHADNEIDLIKEIRNIAEGAAGTYYYGRIDGTDIITYESASFAAADTAKQTTGSCSNVATAPVTRKLGDYIYSAFIYNDGSDFKSTVHTNEGGWQAITDTLTTDENDRAQLVDLIKIGANIWLIYVFNDNSAGTYQLAFHQIGGGADYTGSVYAALQHCFAGNINADGDYEYVDYVGAKYYYNTFDGTVNATQGAEETTFTGITHFDIPTQTYWNKGNLKFLVNKDALFIYDHASTSWTTLTGTVTATCGVIWDQNSSGEYIINYLCWYKQIWKLFHNGGIASFQDISGITNGYSGHSDWFSGYGKIYQLTKSSYAARNCMVKYEIERIPTCTVRTSTALTEDYYILHDNPITGLVDWGTASDPDLSAWTDASGAGCTVSIVDEVDGHKNVMCLDDQSAATKINQLYTFSGAQTSGSFDIWFRSTNTAAYHLFYIYSAASIGIRLLIASDKIQYYYTAAYHDATGGGIADDTWYHFKIVFDCATDTYSFYLNGVLLDDDIPFENVQTSLTKIYFQTIDASTGYTFYLDGLGFSWDGYHSGFDTQAFEGFRGDSVSDGGYYMTPIIHPLAYDLTQKVFIAATNATPHAYIKSMMDTYFKFCTYSATSIDDSFAAMDIPAFQGVSVSYVLRFFNILKTRWWYCDTHSLTIYWNDGTRYGGKDFVYTTEVMKNPVELPFDPVDSVTMLGGYLAGTKLTSTKHATTPGSTVIEEKFPQVITQALLDLLSAAGLAMWGLSQKFYTAIMAGNGLYQYGGTGVFASQKPLSVASAIYYFHSASFDLVERWGKLTVGKYMTVPPRSRDKVQETLQLVDNIEKTIHWTVRDYGLPDFDDNGAEGTALTDDVAWNDLDISAIIGAKTMRVQLHIMGKDNVVNSAVFVRTKGHTGVGCRCTIRTGVAAQEVSNYWIGHTDSAGVLQVQCVPKPTSWTQISVWVTGYKEA
ncbi:MAG: LamG domain-containing protein [Thermodesulfovibrionales bacterium]|nr:LamG domain-containing protein [Thermodesulfovibrionales bacterium]